MEVGLSRVVVMDEADLMLRCEMVKGPVGGPGLVSTSPARRSIKDRKKQLELSGWASGLLMDDFFRRTQR